MKRTSATYSMQMGTWLVPPPKPPEDPALIADAIGDLKALEARVKAEIQKLRDKLVDRALFEVMGGRYRVSFGEEIVSTTLDRKAIEAAMGEAWCTPFLKFSKPTRRMSCAELSVP